MKDITKQKLRKVWIECVLADKSTEFFIQYAQDVIGVNFDCVFNFLKSEVFKEEK